MSEFVMWYRNGYSVGARQAARRRHIGGRGHYYWVIAGKCSHRRPLWRMGR